MRTSRVKCMSKEEREEKIGILKIDVIMSFPQGCFARIRGLASTKRGPQPVALVELVQREAGQCLRAVRLSELHEGTWRCAAAGESLLAVCSGTYMCRSYRAIYPRRRDARYVSRVSGNGSGGI